MDIIPGILTPAPEVILLLKNWRGLVEVPEHIIEGCRQGDRVSQEKLYTMTSSQLYAVCLKYSGNDNDANDIMQEGFIKIFRKMDQYSGKGSLMGWMRRILVNTALEKYRSKIHLQNLDEAPEIQEEPGSSDAIQKLTADEIMEIVRSLSPKYRMVFNLYALEGYSHKEISEMTGISEGTSKSNLSRARGILQAKVNELYSNTVNEGKE